MSLVASFGVTAITSNAITQSIASIQMIPASAVQLATIPIIAQCYGAKDIEQVHYFNRILLRISYGVLCIWSIALFLLLPYILDLYHISIETENMSHTLFFIHMIGGMTLWPLAFNLPASLRATGDVKYPMVISIVSMWVFRYGGAYVLSIYFHLGVVGVWIAMVFLDWGFRTIIYLFRWNLKKWTFK